MTGKYPDKPVFAARMTIQAQRPSLVHGRPLWRALEGGTNQCNNCAGIGIDAVPDGTQRIDVDVVLQAGTAAAGVALYLTSFKP